MRGAEAKVTVRATDYKGGRNLFYAVLARKHPFTMREQREGKGSGGEGAVVRRCGEVL